MMHHDASGSVSIKTGSSIGDVAGAVSVVAGASSRATGGSVRIAVVELLRIRSNIYTAIYT